MVKDSGDHFKEQSLSRSVTLHKKMKFSIKDFYSKCNQIRSSLQFWSHLLKKSSMENVTFCAGLLLLNLVRPVNL